MEARRTGRSRWRLAGVLCAAPVVAMLLVACEPSPTATFTVTSGGDGPDATPGDGTCSTGGPQGCTLRAAVMEANATAGYQAIVVPSGLTVSLTSSGAGEDAGATGDLDVTDGVRIAAAGATIDATGLGDRALDVAAAPVWLRGGTWRGGSTTGDGGVVRVRSTGQLQGVDVVLSDGDADGHGGTLHVGETAQATLTTSSVLGGSAGEAGGAIDADGKLTVVRSSVTGGSAPLGGAISARGPVTVDTSTLVGGTAATGGSLHAGAGAAVALTSSTVIDGAPDPGGHAIAGPGAVTAAGSLFGLPAEGGTCETVLTSGGGNVDADGSCVAGATDQPASDVLLDAVRPVGAAGVSSFAPVRGTAAIDAAATCPAVDIAGLARPQDGDTDNVARCDAGAVELPRLGVGVTTVEDLPDANPGNGVCEVAGGGCSLRAAITEANATGAATTIVLPEEVVHDHSYGPAGDDTNASGDYDVTGNVTITGGGTVLSAGTFDRIFHVHPGGRLRLERTFVQGSWAYGDGGGVRGEAGSTVELIDSRITSNRVISEPGIPRSGAGVSTAGTLVVRGSTLDNNNAAYGGTGGAIHLDGTGTTATIERSTISTNYALAGAAVHVEGTGITVTVTNSTIVANEPDTNAGHVIVVAPGSGSGVSLRNTLLTDHGRGLDCTGNVTSQGYNVFGLVGCNGTAGTDRLATTANLAALQVAPATVTAIHPPLPGSVVIDTGSGCGTIDQRGLPRPLDGDQNGSVICDRGAVEAPSPGLYLAVDTGIDAPDAVAGDGACATAAGRCSLRAAVEESNASAGRDIVRMPNGLTAQLTLGQLTVTDPLAVIGSSPSDPAHLYTKGSRMFEVTGGATLTIQRLAAAVGGVDGVQGGMLRVAAGSSATIEDSHLWGTGAGQGGLIANAGTLTVRRTALSGTGSRSRPAEGLAIYNEGSALVHTSTVWSEQQTAGPGAATTVLAVSGQVRFEHSAIGLSGPSPYGPSAAIGRSGSGSVVLRASFLYRTTLGGSACSHPMTSEGANVSFDSSCALGGTGDLVATSSAQNTREEQIEQYASGFGFLTSQPKAASVLIDRGSAVCDGASLNGRSRPRDGNANGTSLCDTGPWER